VQDSSYELLRSLDPASGSVHCCEVPRRTLRSISKGMTFRDVLLVCVSPEVRASLRIPARCMGVYGWMWRLTVHCVVTPTCMC
jgi:hypothetical protein